MSASKPSSVDFLNTPLPRVFAQVCIPVIMIMTMNGLFSVVDAVILGQFVGPDAVAAVSVVFPAVMLSIAAVTLVGSGMASILARRMGAKDKRGAEQVYVGAHGLSLAVALGMLIMLVLFGQTLIEKAAGGSEIIAAGAWRYCLITFLALPIQFFISIQGDALRNEGQVKMMAIIGIGATLSNMVFSYIFVAHLGLGVAGSAIGTALSQLALSAVIIRHRMRTDLPLPLHAFRNHNWFALWGKIALTGAPVSLTYIGVAFVSICTIIALRIWVPDGYDTQIAAYGILTRIYGFIFLPMIGLGIGMQSIVGQNVGATLYQRSDHALILALVICAIYCFAIEVVMVFGGTWVGRLFIDDMIVITELARMMRLSVLLLIVTGPIMLVGFYFQAIGAPERSAVLTLCKPFLLHPILIFAMGGAFGLDGIWLSSPVGDVIVLAIAIAIWIRFRDGQAGFGLAAEQKARLHQE